MKVAEAKAILARDGYDVMEQRGFYSHFLRVRIMPERQTVATISIEHNVVPRRAVARVLSWTRGIPS